MTLLVPILYSDINFGAKYQVFSIIYGIDINTENLEYGPNVIWNFKSDEDGKKPEVGTIKPEIDMEAMTQSITNQLATFFETRNLRGSTISGFAAGRYGQQDSGGQTGAALLIQNLDTTETRKAHAKIFEAAEAQLWSLLAKYIVPVWLSQDALSTEVVNSSFTGDKILVKFSPEYEVKSDMDTVTEIQQKLNSGLISKRMALKQLYPSLTDDEIELLLKEIENDNSVKVSDVGIQDSSGSGSQEEDTNDSSEDIE
jgi:hypothetical protein